MKILILLITLTSLSLQAFVQTSSIDEEFSKFYYSSQVSDRFCNINIRNFMRHLSKSSLLNSNMKVVHVEAPGHPWTFGRLPGFNSRFAKNNDGIYHQNWMFHVFAIADSQVYDFSFNQTPKVLNFEQYMEEMFVPKRDFMINGPSFRVRGQGPYLTRETARRETHNFIFKVYNVSPNGEVDSNYSQISYADFLKLKL